MRRKERPNFDQIVARLQGDIGDEIKRKEEPKIELYSVEDDLIYRGRIGKEDEILESEGEEVSGFPHVYSCGRSGQNLGLSGGDPPHVEPFARAPQTRARLGWAAEAG